MGYKSGPDIPDIINQIRHIARECSSPYNEGYTAFEHKKDLYLLKHLLDDIIINCPSFEGEEEWLTELEKERIVNYLKK